MAEERDHANINPMIHPPVMSLLFIGIAYFLGHIVSFTDVAPVAVQYFGLFLTFIGFLLGFGAFMEFRKAHTTLDPHGSVSQVVTSGIYRFTRNPIYLGFLLIVIGLPLNSGLFWGIVMAPLYIMTMTHLVIEHEEAYLEKKFKDQYIGYKSRVRRWL